MSLLWEEPNGANDTTVSDTDESSQAAWERLGLEDAWKHDYWPSGGFAG